MVKHILRYGGPIELMIEGVTEGRVEPRLSYVAQIIRNVGAKIKRMAQDGDTLLPWHKPILH